MRDQENGDERKAGVSRRDFLRGSGALAAATALSSAALAEPEAAAEARVLGPGPARIMLNINGQKRSLEVEPRVTLLSALRNHLDLTGAKDVCNGKQTCGSCTVMLDGKPVYACGVLAVEVAKAGQKVTTVESLGGDKLDPVPAAFIHNDGMQCGFCTPGFVVAVRAFLNKNPDATLEEVRKGLGGNICRCGTYMGVTAAALEVAKGGA
ncbi:MAG: (2Fe-2S)-binding protein [Planctomycetes bacterium]|nr:(2Fe-2S)-binding protein [Planctomycetota bacterium]